MNPIKVKARRTYDNANVWQAHPCYATADEAAANTMTAVGRTKRQALTNLYRLYPELRNLPLA